MPNLIIDGSTTQVLFDGEMLGETSKDAVVFQIDQPVAELIQKLLTKNNLLAQKVAGAGDTFVEQILPLMQKAYFEGVEGLAYATTQPLDEHGFRPKVADPYGDQIRSRNELRGL